MVSPTFQVVPGAGVLMVALGAVLPTVVVTVSVSDAPWLSVDPEELDRRRQAWKPPEARYARGALAKYAALVGGADQGAVCG
jgi:hypothetical protein